jgi:hypothetical protein
MFRRSLIRGLALALLTLCVAAWVGSYVEWFEITHGFFPRLISTKIDRGSLRFLSSGTGSILQGEFDWSHNSAWNRDELYLEGIREEIQLSKYHFAGFVYDPRPDSIGTPTQLVRIPLWFPALLSALLLLFVWRKARSPYNGKGFPIQPTEATQKDSSGSGQISA